MFGLVRRRAHQHELPDMAGQAPSDSTNTPQFSHSTPWSSLHHLRPGLGSWGKNKKGVIPIQGLTWMKQALVRSPRRAKELCRTSGIESWGSEQGQHGRAPLPPTSLGPQLIPQQRATRGAVPRTSPDSSTSQHQGSRTPYIGTWGTCE